MVQVYQCRSCVERSNIGMSVKRWIEPWQQQRHGIRSDGEIALVGGVAITTKQRTTTTKMESERVRAIGFVRACGREGTNAKRWLVAWVTHVVVVSLGRFHRRERYQNLLMRSNRHNEESLRYHSIVYSIDRDRESQLF